MDSFNLFSPPSPPPPPPSTSSSTFILCPKSFPSDIEKLFYWSSTKPHHLNPFNLSRINVDKKLDLLCHTCKHETIVCDYWCDKCCLAYHKECLEPPRQIKVLYHPKHPLQRHYISIYDVRDRMIMCHCCGECPDDESLYYRCSICDFNLHTVCAIKQNILSIHYPKRHDHTLIYFPRKSSLVCDICALGDEKYFIYICYQCDFVVHKPCIYLPTTIRISRHDHRLSFTPSLPISNKDWSCGVCRRIVDRNYGEYSCVKGCNYVVHSKCATRRDLWDGKELEGEPENEYEDLKTFEEIRDGIIQHFSHPNHHMKLEKESDKVDEEKSCQACVLPIHEGNVYNCMKCDFILHETCAHLPRRKWHQLHAHALTIQVNHKGGTFICHACFHHCCGFAYKCSEPHCPFTIDVRCALVSEPFAHYEMHPHPLFLPSEEGTRMGYCSICERKYSLLSCTECSFDICFHCATIPYKVKYISDEHFLTLLYEEDVDIDIYCEICEEEADSDEGYYACKLCGVTLHTTCLLGNNPFIKHGESIIVEKVTFLIIPNDRYTRPICRECKRHCLYRVALITLFGMLFCSTDCIYSFGGERLFEMDQQWMKNGKDTLTE
uniref:Zinc finger PHD-type domain-containing protein n=1 Tax=Brassica oleracea TaxID=3712 RepID=A0A3P6F630_BRAOL|nr:unnamed protein product [Brassica oleracea]